MVTTDLAAFLRARLDEDERTSELAAPGPWSETGPDSVGEGMVHSDATGWAVVGSVATGYGPDAPYSHVSLNAAHIARHDPARVLAEVDAKRRLLDYLEYELADHGADNPWWYDDKLLPVLSLLALPYREHPDYQPEWAPEA